jgi:hypothetical protein
MVKAVARNIFMERRRYERFDISLPLEAVFIDKGIERVMRSRSTNICAGGAYFTSAVDFNAGARLSLMIEAPSGSLSRLIGGGTINSDSAVLIKTECEVIRSEADPDKPEEFGLGVMFDGPMRISQAPRHGAQEGEVNTASYDGSSFEKNPPEDEAAGGMIEGCSEGTLGEAEMSRISRIRLLPSASVLFTGKQEDINHV